MGRRLAAIPLTLALLGEAGMTAAIPGAAYAQEQADKTRELHNYLTSKGYKTSKDSLFFLFNENGTNYAARVFHMEADNFKYVFAETTRLSSRDTNMEPERAFAMGQPHERFQKHGYGKLGDDPSDAFFCAQTMASEEKITTSLKPCEKDGKAKNSFEALAGRIISLK